MVNAQLAKKVKELRSRRGFSQEILADNSGQLIEFVNSGSLPGNHKFICLLARSEISQYRSPRGSYI